jgi:hypothetical protein
MGTLVNFLKLLEDKAVNIELCAITARLDLQEILDHLEVTIRQRNASSDMCQMLLILSFRVLFRKMKMTVYKTIILDGVLQVRNFCLSC